MRTSLSPSLYSQALSMKRDAGVDRGVDDADGFLSGVHEAEVIAAEAKRGYLVGVTAKQSQRNGCHEDNRSQDSRLSRWLNHRARYRRNQRSSCLRKSDGESAKSRRPCLRARRRSVA